MERIDAAIKIVSVTLAWGMLALIVWAVARALM